MAKKDATLALRPLDDRVVVEPTDAEEKTAGGILLPDTAKQKPQQGKVVAAGPGKLSDKGERTAVGGEHVHLARAGTTTLLAAVRPTEGVMAAAFRPVPWSEIREKWSMWTRSHPTYSCVLDLIDSVIDSGCDLIILATSTQGASSARGLALTVAYCLGLGIPFLLAAVAADRFAPVQRWLARHRRGIQVFGGVLLIAIGLLLVTGWWDWLTTWLQTELVDNFVVPL